MNNKPDFSALLPQPRPAPDWLIQAAIRDFEKNGCVSAEMKAANEKWLADEMDRMDREIKHALQLYADEHNRRMAQEIVGDPEPLS